MVFNSATRTDSFTVMTKALNKNIDQIKLGNLVYENKQKSLEWSHRRGLSLPTRMSTQGSLNVIQKEDIVNKRTPNFSLSEGKIEISDGLNISIETASKELGIDIFEGAKRFAQAQSLKILNLSKTIHHLLIQMKSWIKSELPELKLLLIKMNSIKSLNMKNIFKKWL